MRRLLLAAALTGIALPAAAEWSLKGDASTLGFVTIKNGDTAEAHSFSGLEGGVDEKGVAEISIPLSSVETFIDIRNERMRDILFRVADFPAATVTAEIPMADLADLADGERATSELDLTLAANGAEAYYFAEVAITRIGPDLVAVSTVRPMIADARDLGYEEGVAQLREIAGLDSISPAVPVTFDLLFTR